MPHDLAAVTVRREALDTAWRSGDAPSHTHDARSPVPALLSGGDSRIAVDSATGTNRYLCPPSPAPHLAAASCCTAVPIGTESFDRAAQVHAAIMDAPTQRRQADTLQAHAQDIAARLLQYFGVADLAEAMLCPSGTDALLTTALLLQAERPGAAMTAILPNAAETGSGVPLAAACRSFDGPNAGVARADCQVDIVEIPLRSADGEPRDPDAVDAAFAAAIAGARGRAVAYLTHGTKTGLIAPVTPPAGPDVIVDACQARIEHAQIAAYLRRGWPVTLTGSKFFGGPAFSGLVLFPSARLAGIRAARHPAPSLGTVLRWTAALTVIEAFGPLSGGMNHLLQVQGAAIGEALRRNPALVPVGGLQPHGAASTGDWTGLPSIFTFGVRDRSGSLLTVAALRPVYEQLAGAGVLLGQPVGLGSFGGLRIAIGARDLIEGGTSRRLDRVFAALDTVTQ